MYDDALDNFVIAEQELDVAREEMIKIGKNTKRSGHRLARKYED